MPHCFHVMNFRKNKLFIIAIWLMDSAHLLTGHSSIWPGHIMHSLCIGKINSSSDSDVMDRLYMRRALELASRAIGKTSPNPCVGCVIVKNGVVIGEGYHKKAGEPHAEVNALREAGEDAKGSTAYVSLEPCNHFGRTPPCTHALERHGVTRVVAGMVDPDPRVSGLGLKYLRDKGIEAQLIPEPEGEMCRDINAPFVFRVLHNRAYAAVWRSLSKLEEGDVNSASGASRGNGNINGKFGNDITSLIEGILPEVNAVVLTASQLDRIHITGAGGPGPAATNTNGLVSLPSHTAVFVVLSGDCDNTNTVTEKIRDLKAAEELSSVNRTWIVVADTESPKELAGIDLKILPSHKSKGSGCFGDVNSLLDVIASSGYNAALIIADSDADLHYLHRNAAVQKLVLTATADVPFSDEDADADPSTASSISGPNEGEFIESCESVFNGLVGGDASCRVHPSNVITKNSLRVFVKKIWSQGDAIDVSKNDL